MHTAIPMAHTASTSCLRYSPSLFIMMIINIRKSSQVHLHRSLLLWQLFEYIIIGKFLAIWHFDRLYEFECAYGATMIISHISKDVERCSLLLNSIESIENNAVITILLSWVQLHWMKRNGKSGAIFRQDCVCFPLLYYYSYSLVY